MPLSLIVAALIRKEILLSLSRLIVGDAISASLSRLRCTKCVYKMLKTPALIRCALRSVEYSHRIVTAKVQPW